MQTTAYTGVNGASVKYIAIVLLFFALHSKSYDVVTVNLGYSPEIKGAMKDYAISNAIKEIKENRLYIVGSWWGDVIGYPVEYAVLEKYNLVYLNRFCLGDCELNEIYIRNHNKIIGDYLINKYGKKFWATVKFEYSLIGFMEDISGYYMSWNEISIVNNEESNEFIIP